MSNFKTYAKSRYQTPFLSFDRIVSFIMVSFWLLSPAAQVTSLAQYKNGNTFNLTKRNKSRRSINLFSSTEQSFLSQSFVDENAPIIRFNGLHHYARVSGMINVGVQAVDDIGVSRIEFYIGGILRGTNDIVPSNPNVSISFPWNTADSPNGKHLAQIKAFDAAGNAKTATMVIVTQNFSVSPQVPTATFTAAPTTILNGQSATLTWTTTNAASVTINQGIGTVSASGSLAVSPTTTRTYTLTATSQAGSVTKNVTISVTPLAGNNIALNSAVRHQTITGWEATAQAGQLNSLAWNNYKTSLLDQAVNDFGINRIRLEFNSGMENPTDYYAQWRAGQITENQYNNRRYEIINDNSDPNSINPNGFKWSNVDGVMNDLILPLKQRLQARGETLWVNCTYVDFGASAFEHKNNPAEYAEFVLAAYRHLQTTYGIVPDSWEISLEPDNAAWSADQVAQAIKAAGDLLTAHNFTPNFVAGSNVNAGNTPSYIAQIANTPGAMQYVSEFAYHRYGGASDPVVQNIANLAIQYNKNTAMLEGIGSDYIKLHTDLKIGRNSSWQEYALAGPLSWGADDGSRYYLIDDSNVNNPTIIMGSRTQFLRQYFKFIRRGAQRIEATSGNSNFDPLAFINSNGKYVVVVKTTASGSFNIQGLSAGTYGIKYTTASQYNIDLTDVAINTGQTLSTTIPAAGVITIYAR